MTVTEEGQIVVEDITFTVFKVPGDGNCMFHAFCKDPYFAQKGYRQQRLRNELALHVEELYHNHSCVQKAVHNNINPPKYDGTIKSLLKRIRLDWCGQFESTFIALMFPVRVTMVRPDEEPGTYKFGYSSEEQLRICRIGHLKKRDGDLHDVTLMFYEMKVNWDEGMAPMKEPNHFTWLRKDSDIDIPAAYEKQIQRITAWNETDPVVIDKPTPPNSNDIVVQILLGNKTDPIVIDESTPPNSNDVVVQIPLKDTALLQRLKSHALPQPVKSDSFPDRLKCNDSPQLLKSDDSPGDILLPPMSESISKKVKLNVGEWYELTHFFHNNKNTYKSQKSFLESHESHPLTAKDKSSFSRNYKAYMDGSLGLKKNPERKRNRQSPYSGIEKTLHQYLKTEKLNLSHKQVRQKALEIWNNNNFECKLSFNASKGWLDRMLKRSQIKLCRK